MSRMGPWAALLWFIVAFGGAMLLSVVGLLAVVLSFGTDWPRFAIGLFVIGAMSVLAWECLGLT